MAKKSIKRKKIKVDRQNFNLFVKDNDNTSGITLVKMPIEHKKQFITTFGLENIPSIQQFEEFMNMVSV